MGKRKYRYIMLGQTNTAEIFEIERGVAEFHVGACEMGVGDKRLRQG